MKPKRFLDVCGGNAIEKTSLILVFSAMILLFSVVHVRCENRPRATMAEISQIINTYQGLPAYCQVRLAERDVIEVRHKTLPAEFQAVHQKWAKPFGNNWTYFHHYCWGISRLNAARGMLKPDQQMLRTGTLKWALEDLEFMRKAADRFFPLWYDLLNLESQCYMELGDPVNAQLKQQQALRIKQYNRNRR